MEHSDLVYVRNVPGKGRGVFARGTIRKGTIIDSMVSVFAITGVSTPTFWLGILLVLFLSAELNLRPSAGRLPYGVEVPHVTGLYLVDAVLAGRFDLLGLIASFIALPR